MIKKMLLKCKKNEESMAEQQTQLEKWNEYS